MNHSVWQWIGNEAVLHQFVQGFSTPVLLLLIFVCIAVLSFGADKMIDGVVSLAMRTGLPTVVIGVAARHIHSDSSIIHRDDYDNAVKLLVETIQRLDKEKVAEFTA